MKVEDKNREDYGEDFDLEKKDKEVKVKDGVVFRPTIYDASLPISPVSWVLNGFIIENFLNIIGGKAGGGKTTFYLKLAQLNAGKKEFWSGGPVGDGRKSAVICDERDHGQLLGQLIACGGSKNDIHIYDQFIMGNGEKEPLFKIWKNKKKVDAFFKHIMKQDYAMLIIDPLVTIELNGQNDNEAVRAKLFDVLSYFKLSGCGLVGTMHLAKHRKDLDEMGSLRGATEWPNVAATVAKIYDLTGGRGHVLIRVKSNFSEDGLKGGIKFKIKSKSIPENLFYKWFDSKKHKNTFGAIEKLEYTSKTAAAIKAECEKDNEPLGESFSDELSKVINTFIEEKRPLNTSELMQACVYEKETRFVSQYKWRKNKDEVIESLGYRLVPRGQGKKLKIWLVPKSERENEVQGVISDFNKGRGE